MNISVILPTYNRAQMVIDTLVSLASQDYPKNNFEILVIDNNSTDNTKDVVRDYILANPDVMINYIFEPRQGLVFSRHRGAQEAKNEILSFCDDDGIYCSSWLTEIANVFAMDEQVSAVGGKIVIRWDKAPPSWVLPYEDLLGRIDLGNEILIQKGLYINGGNFSIKKSVLYKVGGFNPDQIGDWLIGDGETGLCRKLHESNYLIGWAPKALMEHCQTVNKNATVADIKRRYINNGIAVPYRIFAVERKSTGSLLINLIKNLSHLVCWSLRRAKRMLKGNKEDEYNAIFHYAYYASQFQYTLKLLRDQEFRQELLRNDWL